MSPAVNTELAGWWKEALLLLKVWKRNDVKHKLLHCSNSIGLRATSRGSPRRASATHLTTAADPRNAARRDFWQTPTSVGGRSRSTLPAFETRSYHRTFSATHMDTFLNRVMSGPKHALCSLRGQGLWGVAWVANVVTGRWSLLRVPYHFDPCSTPESNPDLGMPSHKPLMSLINESSLTFSKVVPTLQELQ